MKLEGLLRLLLKTSGFRLALRSLALSLGGAALVFLIIHHAAEVTVRGQFDETVAGEISDVVSDTSGNQETLTQSVEDAMAQGGGAFYAVLAPDGTLRAGNFRLSRAAAARWRGARTLHRRDGVDLPPRVEAIRGTARRFPDGQTLFVAENAGALVALNKLIARSFAAVFGTILAMGLLSGYLAARATLTRVDAFAKAIGEIMEGDLARRVPVSPAGDEFDRLATSLNAMLRRIQELMENLRQVTNDISHDLRSPLARLREHLELSRRRFTGPGLPQMFDEALAQIDQALEIFAAMLRIAEVEAGARRSHFGLVPLSGLLETLAESYEPAFSAAGITLSADTPAGLTLRGDKDLLQQMVANLLDNVMLHAAGASEVAIRAAPAGSGIRIIVADNGTGIPPGQRARVLQRFARLDAARHLAGHGLGLSLAAAIAALHDGNIELRDNGPGLMAVVSLGRSQDARPG